MPRGSRPSSLTLRFMLILWTSLGCVAAASAGEPPLPKVAAGWTITLVEQAPRIAYPTAIVVTPDGTIFLGQDPMNMPGPATEPIDSVLTIQPDGSTHVFASKLQSVMGLEWIDGTLYVVHAPFLSSFRDTNGDGTSDVRVDLVTGLGPKVPGSNGLNDHIASGIRLGVDGFLYISVGDKGMPAARGTDGKTITLSTGGVIRVRPDGTDLEVVSSGERNPLSVALSPRDDVFTFGNDDDSHLWPNSLTHHIVGGHYGYPYEFRDAPHRALPIMAGQTGGAGAQGFCSNDAGLPERFRGNLFFCDWGLGAVARYEVEPKGATFRVVRREGIVEKGELTDFRPFGIAATADGSGFYITDWAFNGWLGDGPPTGRLFRLDYTGADRVEPRLRRPAVWPGRTRNAQVVGLYDQTLAVRLANQRALIQQGPAAVEDLIRVSVDHGSPGLGGIGRAADSERGRTQAVWALDALNFPAARAAIRAALGDDAPAVRAEAARSVGIRRDPLAESVLVRLLADADPTVRREAAIALGRLPMLAPATRSALYAGLGEPDPIVAWSIRRAIRSQKPLNPTDLSATLADPSRRDSALTLADGWYTPEVVRVLVDQLSRATLAADVGWRARVVAALGGLYAQVPAWSGHWMGSNPVIGPKPKPTVAWDPASSDLVLAAMGRALRDADVGVRRQAIIACLNIGMRATPLLRALLDGGGIETDPVNILAVVRHLGEQKDVKAVAGLARKLADPGQSEEVRLAALDALGQLTGPTALNARLMVLYDSKSPDTLLARALPALGRGRALPSNDLVGFLDHKSAVVRAAALRAWPTEKPLATDVVAAMMLHAEDPAPEVRAAFVAAAGTYKLRPALPRLVELARSPDRVIQAEATRALAAIPDRSALPAFAAALNDRDPDLRRVGLAGLTAIRAEVIPDLTMLAERGTFVGPGALAVEQLLATWQPLTAWRVIGPFPRATGPRFADAAAIDFTSPTTGLDGKAIFWQTRQADPQSGILTLDVLTSRTTDAGVQPLTAFVVAEVESAQNRGALLLIDTTGPTVVTLNDRPVTQYATGASSETVRVDLIAGLNRILLRTRQAGQPWTIRVALADSGSLTGGALSGPQSTSIARAGLRAFATKVAGDPKNGATIFAETGCIRCHAGSEQAAALAGLGPDLAGLALKYDKAEMIRSVLEPSHRIAVGFTPIVINRTDGTSLTGLLAGETAAAIELITADGGHVQIPRTAINQQQVSTISVMPAGLVDGLRPVEFADLIAYLMSLKPRSPLNEKFR